MDFVPYASAYLNRVFLAEGEPVTDRLRHAVRHWPPTVTEQRLVQDFSVLPVSGLPQLMAGYVVAHIHTLALSRISGGVLVAVVHSPSLLRREIRFEIGIGIGPTGVTSARLKADPTHEHELSLFLLGMGSLQTMNKALTSFKADGN